MIEMYCATCGSTQVRRDAEVEWDYAQQQWVLVALHDSAHCEQCEEECNIEERTGPYRR